MIQIFPVLVAFKVIARAGKDAGVYLFFTRFNLVLCSILTFIAYVIVLPVRFKKKSFLTLSVVRNKR